MKQIPTVLFFVSFMFIKTNCNIEQNNLLEEDVLFGVTEKFSNGIFGSRIGINEKYAIEVHETSNETLWYRTGEWNHGLRINWSEPFLFDVLGTNPSIAINENNQIVMVFELENSLFYKTGLLMKKHEISWNPTKMFAVYGQNPSIALASDGIAIEMHEADNQLFYQLGHLTDGSIDFKPSVTLTNGSNCTVAVNKKLEIVEVHYFSYSIFYTVGTIENGIVHWAETYEMQKGLEATVSINDKSQMFVLLQKQNLETVSILGLLDNTTKTIEWSNERKLPINGGFRFNIAANNHFAVLTHDGNITTSLIRNRKKWMELTQGVSEKPLWQLTLPGSHDAGAYSLSVFRVKEGCKKAPDFIPGILTKLYAETQNEDMISQLNNGIRYFDIRPYYWPGQEGGTNDFHVYHDNIGPRISRILYLTKVFMESVHKELVILRFSHFCEANFDNQTGAVLHGRLSLLIKSILGDYLLNLVTQDSSIFKIKLAEFVKTGPKVLVIYDNDFASNNAQALGFLRRRPYFDEYSNTDNLAAMQFDQFEKLKLNYGTENRLFLLSYTMTWQLTTFSNPDADTLHGLSKNASRSLADFIDDNDNLQINIIFVDFCSESRVTDVAISSIEKRIRNSA